MITMDNGVLTTGRVSEDDRPSRMAILVNAARAGKTDAIGDLVTELTPMLWHVARATGLGTADAEDVVQSVWLALLGHLDTIRSPEALTSWLVTTTRREAWRVRAAGRRQLPVDREWFTAIPDDSETDAVDNVIMADEHRALWMAFRSLPDRCQRLLRIVAYVQRPDYDEIAAMLGMPRGSVGPNRGRCLDKLRSALNAAGDRK